LRPLGGVYFLAYWGARGRLDGFFHYLRCVFIDIAVLVFQSRLETYWSVGSPLHLLPC
jgi:hypothetical protein